MLLAEPLLAVRGHRPRHQDLGPREQEPGRGAETRGEHCSQVLVNFISHHEARQLGNLLFHFLSQVAGNGDPPQCLSMAWSADGQTLFAGYSDNQIRVWQVSDQLDLGHLSFI